jgi:hypothetical protein
VIIPLSIALPEDYEWLETKITNSSPDVKAQITIHKNSELCFDLGLFRRDEKITFQALAKTPSLISQKQIRESLLKNLKFHHRIAETGNKIRKKHFYSKNTQFTDLILPLIAMALVLLVFISFFLLSETTIAYEIKTTDGATLNVRVDPYPNGNLKLTGIENNYTESIKFEEFYIKYNPKPFLYKYREINSTFTIYYSILLFSSFIVMGYTVIDYINNRKLGKIIKQ